MKRMIALCALLLVASCTLPLAGYYGAQTLAGQEEAAAPGQNQDPAGTAAPSGTSGKKPDAPAASTAPESPSATEPPAAPAVVLEPLYILDKGSGTILTVSVRDYLIGAVASEMPVTWPDAALQAQAVACHSYALYCKAHNDPAAHAGAYFSADPARRQNFMTDAVLQSYWGTDYAENYARVSALVDAVLDQILTYEGEPAAACYFACSAGRTEASQNVWDTALPYLQGVDSSRDKAAEQFAATVTYSSQQMYDLLVEKLGLSPGNTRPEQYFSDYTYTDAGYVKTVQVCGTSQTGAAVRKALGLRSSCFAIAYADTNFTVTTYGYGHGVGLSQEGARAMAESGSGWREILEWYFPGTEVERAMG